MKDYNKNAVMSWIRYLPEIDEERYLAQEGLKQIHVDDPDYKYREKERIHIKKLSKEDKEEREYLINHIRKISLADKMYGNDWMGKFDELDCLKQELKGWYSNRTANKEEMDYE